LSDSHRSAFGEHGGESSGFIERTFRERIVLAGVTLPPSTEEDTEAGLDELEALVDTAGADVVDRVVQRRQTPDPATYIGRGKAGELRDAAEAADCDTVVFDDELSPAQQRNLEKILGRTAIDRTAVILDIFGQNASSQEGKAHKLEAELRDVAAHRETQRKRAKRSRAANVAIVGYTNAGKSTLLNQLTDSGVLVEDRLFATLDATTRRLQLPGGEAVLVTDTVGFVRKLPHQLVEAFRSTLQVAADADLLVHVVDASAADPVAQMDAVRDVLVEIGAADVPELLCFNKADLAPEAKRLVDRNPGSVAISARTGEGIEDLLIAIGDRLRAQTNLMELYVPYARGDVLAEIHREGEVLSETAGPDGVVIRARLDPAGVARLGRWSTAAEQQ
jgi:GTP-binding protein HflX